MTFVLAHGESPSPFLTNAKNVGPFPNPPGDAMAELGPTKATGIVCDVSIGSHNSSGKELVVHIRKNIHHITVMIMAFDDLWQ